jgi:hypothetical protein
MVVSHLTGTGAAEMVRFWGEPPLVREPDLALFGVARLDLPEEQLLTKSPLRRFLASDIQRMGAAAAALAAVDRIHANGYQFILHFDVDVIADFQATNYPGTGGLSLDDVRDALEVFATQKHLAAIEVAAYNPTKDSDGSGAKLIVELLSDVLGKRLEILKSAAPAASAQVEAPIAATTKSADAPAEEPQTSTASASGAAAPDAAPVIPGESWSLDLLGDEATAADEGANPDPFQSSGDSSGEEDESRS